MSTKRRKGKATLLLTLLAALATLLEIGALSSPSSKPMSQR